MIFSRNFTFSSSCSTRALSFLFLTISEAVRSCRSAISRIRAIWSLKSCCANENRNREERKTKSSQFVKFNSNLISGGFNRRHNASNFRVLQTVVSLNYCLRSLWITTDLDDFSILLLVCSRSILYLGLEIRQRCVCLFLKEKLIFWRNKLRIKLSATHWFSIQTIFEVLAVSWHSDLALCEGPVKNFATFDF